MGKTQSLSEMTRSLLERSYTLQREDLGADAHLSAKGMAFDTEAWEIPGLGHFCLMRMKAFFGLMKMDVPLLNLDWVRAFGKETQIAELYDTQLTPYPAKKLAAFEALRVRDDELPSPPSKAHWYDAILYPCSYHKAGKGVSERFARAARDYLETFLRQLAEAPACDAAAKAEKNRAFAERLFAEGGPAVDQVTKLFGRETARRLILRWMYGVR